MDKQKYSIVKKDCIKWMNAQKPKLVDCVITSPPYNLNIKYANYDDSISRKNISLIPRISPCSNNSRTSDSINRKSKSV